jgi:Bacterial antitoxin of ParD toxin-antitoxin type II system and RHH
MGVGLAAAQNTNNRYPALAGENTSFGLDEHYSSFIDGEVAAGCYRSASDVVLHDCPVAKLPVR